MLEVVHIFGEPDVGFGELHHPRDIEVVSLFDHVTKSILSPDQKDDRQDPNCGLGAWMYEW